MCLPPKLKIKNMHICHTNTLQKYPMFGPSPQERLLKKKKKLAKKQSLPYLIKHVKSGFATQLYITHQITSVILSKNQALHDLDLERVCVFNSLKMIIEARNLISSIQHHDSVWAIIFVYSLETTYILCAVLFKFNLL